MTRFFRFSLVAYRGLLVLYPRDLRSEFGGEILEAFQNDLAAGYAARRIRGALHVWRVALREVVHIAVPQWLRIPAIVVPALSAAAVVISNSPLLIAAIQRRGDATPADALTALAIAGTIAALTSFVAVHGWKRAALISLGLR